MTTNYRFFGKRQELPPSKGEWKFESRPGGWVIATRTLPSGEVQRKRLIASQAKGKLTALIAGKYWSAEKVVVERGASGTAGGDADLVAKFPGKVRKILVEVGQSVKEGDKLLLVEAMKMEFAIKSPYDGKVTRIGAQAGSQIKPGDQLIEVEESLGEKK